MTKKYKHPRRNHDDDDRDGEYDEEDSSYF